MRAKTIRLALLAFLLALPILGLAACVGDEPPGVEDRDMSESRESATRPSGAATAEPDATKEADSPALRQGRKEEVREPFVEDDTRSFLKAAAGPLVKPLVDDSVADIRRNLSRDGRLDVLEWIAGEPGGLTKEDMEEQAESLRGVVSAANGPGSIVALVMVIVIVL